MYPLKSFAIVFFVILNVRKYSQKNYVANEFQSKVYRVGIGPPTIDMS